MNPTSIFDDNSSDNKELQDHISLLPQDCLRTVMKLTSAQDACRSAAVCTIFQSVLNSDDLWEHFLPADLPYILSRTEMDDNQLPLKKKELYLYLCHNWMCLDDGLKSFGLDLSSGAKKMFLPEKSLLIVDSRETPIPIFWINGTIDCKDLSRETNYAAYLIFTRMLYSDPGVHHDMQNNEQHDVNVSIICNYFRRLHCDMSSGRPLHFIYRKCKKGVWQESRMREDGQWEVKLGNFSTRFREDRKLYFYFVDSNTKLLKNELTVTGAEVRPED